MGSNTSKDTEIDVELWRIAAKNDLENLSVKDVLQIWEDEGFEGLGAMDTQSLEKRLKHIQEEVENSSKRGKKRKRSIRGDEMPYKRQKINSKEPLGVEVKEGHVLLSLDKAQGTQETLQITCDMWAAIKHNISSIDKSMEELEKFAE